MNSVARYGLVTVIIVGLGSVFPGRADAVPTKVTYSGVITSLPNSQSSWKGYNTGDRFSLALTLNPAYPGPPSNTSCGTAVAGDSYTWIDSSCSQKLFSNIQFTNSFGSFNTSYASSVGTMVALDSGPSVADGNPVFSGTNLATSPSNNSGIYVGSNPNQTYLSKFEVTTNLATSYEFTNTYLQPYVNVGSTLPTPSYFMQYYYSSSYYRDYSISQSPTAPTASLSFLGEGSPLTFSLQGMDIVNDVPSPLPVIGATSAFFYSRKLRKRIRLSNNV